MSAAEELEPIEESALPPEARKKRHFRIKRANHAAFEEAVEFSRVKVIDGYELVMENRLFAEPPYNPVRVTRKPYPRDPDRRAP